MVKKTIALFALAGIASLGFYFRPYLISYIALSSVQRKMYLSSKQYRDTMTPKIISAKACLVHYRILDPITDAQSEAKRPIPRFFYHFYYAGSSGFTGTGLPSGCDPDYEHLDEPGWQPVNQYGSVGFADVNILDQCDSAALRYAGQFNKRLAALRTDRIRFACLNRISPEEVKKIQGRSRIEQQKHPFRAHMTSSIIVRHIQAATTFTPMVASPPLSLPSRSGS